MDAGYNVITANNDQEALELYQKEHTDAMFTDGTMPKMNGYDLAIKIRKIDPEYPIAMLSANFITEKDTQKALDTGVNVCLNKPVSISEILETIDGFFNQT